MITGCKKKNAGVWDDDSTAGNYRGQAHSLWGQDESAQDEDFFGPTHEDFIGLKENDLLSASSDNAIPQPRFSPGERGSGLPGIEAFRSPTGAESSVFKNIHFNTDEHTIRNKEDLAIVDRIASYLKEHAQTVIFVSGHCDERAPEAYNLALGTRRANAIRAALIKKGIDAERVHTVSYGKERPLDFGHNQEAWSINRRGEFRLYDQQ
jgi:peptidoglycan-associated lipoprotein